MGRLLIPERMVTLACELIEQSEPQSEPQSDYPEVVTESPASASLPPQDAPQDPNRATDFRAVATAALNRGFKYLTPIRPDAEKKPILRGFNTRKPTTQEQIDLWAQKFPDFGVGIVCRHGVGTSMVFDCDSEGLLEQIEEETGRKMPDTLVNASRINVPWKRHFYFTQTEYSRKNLPKTINAQNVYSRYDVKINGQAIAAGTTHYTTGLPYTTVAEVEGFPIGIPVPDWLIDWFVMDRERCKEQRRTNPSITPIKKKTKTPDCEKSEQLKMFDRKGRYQIHHSKGEKVPVGERYKTLCSKAGTWASSGMPRDGIEYGLKRFAQDECEDGIRYARENYKLFHKIAYSKTLRKGTTWVGTKVEELPVPINFALSRHRILVDTARTFPDGITTDERYAQFYRALEGTGFALDKKSPNDKEAIKKVRVEAGFVTKGNGRYAKWYRVQGHVIEPVTSTPSKVTGHVTSGHLNVTKETEGQM